MTKKQTNFSEFLESGRDISLLYHGNFIKGDGVFPFLFLRIFPLKSSTNCHK